MSIVFAILGFLVLYFGVLAIIARIFVFPYRTPVYISPAYMNLPQENLMLTNDKGHKLMAWWVHRDDPDLVAIFAHGYIMNRSELVPTARAFHRWNCAVLMFDFRAHGHSQGRKTTLGWEERFDLRAAVEEARKRYPGKKIVLLGSSMGGACGAYAVSEDPDLFDAMILDAAYGELLSAVDGWWDLIFGQRFKWIMAPVPLLGAPMMGVNPYKISVTRSLANYRKPVLLIHGRDDRLAKPSDAEANFKSLPGPKKLIWFDHSGHSEPRLKYPFQYDESIHAFLVEHGLLPESTPFNHETELDAVELDVHAGLAPSPRTGVAVINGDH